MGPAVDSRQATFLAVAVAAVAVALIVGIRRRRRQRPAVGNVGRKQPPVVGRLPIIGSCWHLREPWYGDLYQRFGDSPVVVAYFGLQKVYIFNQWQPFKEAMVDNAEKLTGRMSQIVTRQLFGCYGGIVHCDGELWREYRRFTLQALRDLGFGRRAGEELVLSEAEHLCRFIDAADGAALETSELFSSATANVICQLVFGSRLASEDPDFRSILDVFRRITQGDNANIVTSIFMSSFQIFEKFPFALSLLAAAPGSGDLLANHTKLVEYCRRHKDRHAAEMVDVHRARDYVEAHLLHQAARPEVFNDTRLTLAVGDLFIAGTDTTSHTLRWAMLYMILNPRVADKVRAEIDDGVGRERLPSMSDKAKLPYTLAVIEEVLRKSSLVPLGFFHRVTDSVRVGEYQLEKNAICTFNVFAIHHDRRLFPQPNEFRPERHLRDGQFVGCEFQASFGLGRRACLGESLARMELLIFFGAIMQRYTVALDPTDGRSALQLAESSQFFEGKAMRAPPVHRIVFTPR